MGDNNLAEKHIDSASNDLHTSEVIQNTTEQDGEPEIETDISDLVTEIIDNPNITKENQGSIRNINTNNGTHIIQYDVENGGIVVKDGRFIDIYSAKYVKTNTGQGRFNLNKDVGDYTTPGFIQASSIVFLKNQDTGETYFSLPNGGNIFDNDKNKGVRDETPIDSNSFKITEDGSAKIPFKFLNDSEIKESNLDKYVDQFIDFLKSPNEYLANRYNLDTHLSDTEKQKRLNEAFINEMILYIEELGDTEIFEQFSGTKKKDELYAKIQGIVKESSPEELRKDLINQLSMASYNMNHFNVSLIIGEELTNPKIVKSQLGAIQRKRQYEKGHNKKEKGIVNVIEHIDGEFRLTKQGESLVSQYSMTKKTINAMQDVISKAIGILGLTSLSFAGGYYFDKLDTVNDSFQGKNNTIPVNAVPGKRVQLTVPEYNETGIDEITYDTRSFNLNELKKEYSGLWSIIVNHPEFEHLDNRVLFAKNLKGDVTNLNLWNRLDIKYNIDENTIIEITLSNSSNGDSITCDATGKCN